jgi:cysteine desulfurase
MTTLRDLLQSLLLEAIPTLVLNGHPVRRLPNTLNVSFPGIDGGQILAAIPELCASTGAACHDQAVELSHVLSAMNISESVGRGAVRLTLGRENTESDIRKAATLLIKAYKNLHPS